tara:strand:- start:1835 stop:2824 length:990 start_codon:yes stop_codon:yes gene_type:complete
VTRYFFSKIIALSAGILLVIIAYNHNSNSLYKINGNAYGTTWSITSTEYLGDHHIANIESIIERIDFVASNYKNDSEINKINMNQNKSQFVSNDLFNILKIAKEVENNSLGYYNIMLGKLSSELGFSPTFNQNPLQKKVSTFDLDERNNSLIKNSDNWFDLSSIAKGYAVQEIHYYLLENNLSNHLIDIGGELIINGLNNGKPWSVGIQDPNSIKIKPIIMIQNTYSNFLAIATSGEYRNYKFDTDGNRVTHTINPNTLRPISNDILSVTVVHEYSATYADAYATAFNAMGPKKAIDIANNNNIALMAIIDNGVGIQNLYSNKWYDLKL